LSTQGHDKLLTINIRAQVGKDWKTLARELGYSEVSGLFAVENEGNPAWEDIEYEEENAAQFEEMWKSESE
jgi:hypothetical protein